MTSVKNGEIDKPAGSFKSAPVNLPSPPTDAKLSPTDNHKMLPSISSELSQPLSSTVSEKIKGFVSFILGEEEEEDYEWPPPQNKKKIHRKPRPDGKVNSPQPGVKKGITLTMGEDQGVGQIFFTLLYYAKRRVLKIIIEKAMHLSSPDAMIPPQAVMTIFFTPEELMPGIKQYRTCVHSPSYSPKWNEVIVLKNIPNDLLPQISMKFVIEDWSRFFDPVYLAEFEYSLKIMYKNILPIERRSTLSTIYEMDKKSSTSSFLTVDNEGMIIPKEEEDAITNQHFETWISSIDGENIKQDNDIQGSIIKSKYSSNISNPNKSVLNGTSIKDALSFQEKISIQEKSSLQEKPEQVTIAEEKSEDNAAGANGFKSILGKLPFQLTKSNDEQQAEMNKKESVQETEKQEEKKSFFSGLYSILSKVPIPIDNLPILKNNKTANEDCQSEGITKYNQSIKADSSIILHHDEKKAKSEANASISMVSFYSQMEEPKDIVRIMAVSKNLSAGRERLSYGQLLLSVAFLTQIDSFCIQVIKADMESHKDTPLSPCVKIKQVKIIRANKQKLIDTRSTTPRLHQNYAVWNESFYFKMESMEKLRKTAFDIEIFQHHDHRILGKLRLAERTTQEMVKHWNEMLTHIGLPVSQWHTIRL